MNRPIAAMWEMETLTGSTTNQRGRLVVFGSVDIFADDWIDKDENIKLCDLLTLYLLNEVEIDMTTKREDAKIDDYKTIPNIETLSEVLKPCLQSLDELPRDFTKLFDGNMFSFHMLHVPTVLSLYEKLGVNHEPLSLIPPQFEVPLPKLSIATFPPAMREPLPPALDQFDLDECFAKEDIRLAQLTNKCTSGEEDLEYYISESGEILGVTGSLIYGERSAKHILYAIFKTVLNCKRQEWNSNMNNLLSSDGLDMKINNVSYEDSPQKKDTKTHHVAHVDLAPLNPNMRNSQKLQVLSYSKYYFSYLLFCILY
jgi:intraflagellar transport protein 52